MMARSFRSIVIPGVPARVMKSLQRQNPNDRNRAGLAGLSIPTLRPHDRCRRPTELRAAAPARSAHSASHQLRLPRAKLLQFRDRRTGHHVQRVVRALASRAQRVLALRPSLGASAPFSLVNSVIDQSGPAEHRRTPSAFWAQIQPLKAESRRVALFARGGRRSFRRVSKSACVRV
jgi:hypothetical protein